MSLETHNPLVLPSLYGMVQANVGQKLLICDILRVFFGDRFPLIHTTSCKINAIHKLIVIVFLLQ